MPSRTRSIACLAACFALAGCASQDLMVKRQSEAEAKLEMLIQTDRKTGQQVNELGSQILSLQDQHKASVAQINQLQATIQELRAGQDELKARLSLLTRQNATPKIEVVNQEPSKGKDSGPPAEYLRAFGLYSANNFAAAVEAFETFLKHSPTSDYAANAQYWIGECHYSQSDLPKARAAFQKAAESFPKSPKAPDALLKLGYTLAAMNQRDQATAVYENLIRSYPSSAAAIKARERLTSR